MKKLLLLAFVTLSLFARTDFSDPQPSFMEPRKWLIKVNTNDLDKVNHTIDAVNNVLKEYPMESLKVAMIFYSKGVRVIKKDYDKKTLSRIRSLRGYDVELILCKNTMETMGWSEDQFLGDLTYVQAGVAEAIERVVGGWVDVTPY